MRCCDKPACFSIGFFEEDTSYWKTVWQCATHFDSVEKRKADGQQ